jgi:cytochrome c553
MTLSDQDIEDVAAYFSAQVPTGQPAEPGTFDAGQKLFRFGDRARGIPACSSCHGPAGHGNPAAGYPALRGQQPTYLVKQLSAYNGNVRYTRNEKGASDGGDPAAIMIAIASRLSEADMNNLAAYVKGLH